MSSLKMLKSVLEDINDSGKIRLEMLKDLTDDEKEIVKKLYEEDLITETSAFLDELDTDEEWERIKQKMIASKKQAFPFWNPLLKYAAVFIGFVSLGYFVFVNKTVPTEVPLVENAVKLKIGVDNTTVINQDESQLIVSSNGRVLAEQIGNKIKYRTNSEISELIYNELEIPLGKIFEVELSDGTLVYLNSGTKMRYPVKFLEDRKRTVFIEGEAYFKVAKDATHPFVVYAEELAVEVLGTEFNVSSYREDTAINTVLVEGSVRISNSIVPSDDVVLIPGTKGSWHKTSHTTETEDVDVNLYTGWIKGEMVFRHTSFATMIKKLERSYNVTIINNKELLGDKMFNAKFNVNIESIDDVLKSISEIHPFKYQIQNRIVEIN